MSPFSIAGDVFRWIADVIYWIANRVPDIPFIGDWIEDRLDDIAWFILQIALAFYKLDEWWDIVWDFMFDIPNKLINIWQYLIDKLEPVWNWFVDVAGWVAGILAPVYSWVVSWVADVAGSIKTWFLDTLPGYLADFGKVVKGWLSDLDIVWNNKFNPFKPLLDLWIFYGKRLVDFLSDPVGYIAAALEAALIIMLQFVGWPFLKAIEAFLDRIWWSED